MVQNAAILLVNVPLQPKIRFVTVDEDPFLTALKPNLRTTDESHNLAASVLELIESYMGAGISLLAQSVNLWSRKNAKSTAIGFMHTL